MSIAASTMARRLTGWGIDIEFSATVDVQDLHFDPVGSDGIVLNIKLYDRELSRLTDGQGRGPDLDAGQCLCRGSSPPGQGRCALWYRGNRRSGGHCVSMPSALSLFREGRYPQPAARNLGDDL